MTVDEVFKAFLNRHTFSFILFVGYFILLKWIIKGIYCEQKAENYLFN